jgi:hypothetical protein
VTTTKKRTHAKPPAYLTESETKLWKAHLTELHRLERGLEELGTMRKNYCGKDDFDIVARSNRKFAVECEAKMIALEKIASQRGAAKKRTA